MDTLVFAAVLCAAACHAGWNALIKTGLDPLLSATLMALSGAVIAMAAIPFFAIPAAAAWPWLIASSIVHLLYFGGLIEAYRAGDLGQVYPIARGAAPLMTAVASTLVVGEWLGPLGWAGILLLASGVLLLSIRGSRDVGRLDRRAVGFALFTALTICTYSVIDGIGARSSGAPAGYVLWLFIGMAATLLPYAMVRRGVAVFADIGRLWPRGLAGGAMQIASYGTVLWAMTLAPIAVVAALRETSVLFGAAIAVVALKEPLRVARIVAALMIVAGLIAIRVQ